MGIFHGGVYTKPMKTPEHPGIPLIEEIELATTLEEIPDGPECLVCGTQTVKAYVAYQLGLENASMFTFPRASGYQCPEDETTYVSAEAVIEAFEKARKRLLTRGDSASVQRLDRSKRFQQGLSEDAAQRTDDVGF